MNLFYRRPLFFVTLLFPALLACFAPLPAVAQIGALCVSATGLLLSALRRCRRLILLFSASVVAALLVLFAYTYPADRVAKTEGAVSSISGTVTGISYSEDGYSIFTARLYTLNDRPLLTTCEISLHDPAEIRVGMRFTLRASLSVLSPTQSPLVRLCADECSDLQITKTPGAVRSAMTDLSDRLSDRLYAVFDPDTAGLLRAVLLGNRDGLDDQTNLAFRRIGIAHVLALSGLHLVILAGGLRELMRLLHIHKKIILICTALFILFYLGLTGFSLSVVRAGIMAMMAIGASLISENYDSPTALSTTASVLALFSPGVVYDPSYLLSFFATAGVLLAGHLLNRIPYPQSRLLRFWKRHILPPPVVTIGASLLTLPFVSLFFGSFSLLSIPANIIVVPLLTLQMYLAIPVLLFGNLLAPVGEVLALPAQAAVFLSSQMSSWNAPLLPVGSSVVTLCCALSLGVLLLFLALPSVSRRTGTFLIGIIVLLNVVPISVQAVVCHTGAVLQYGVSDTSEFLIVRDGSESALLDIGNGSKSSYYDAADLLRAGGITDLQQLILTHYHNRITDGVSYLFRTVKVENFCLPYPGTQDEYLLFLQLCTLAESAGISPVIFYRTAPLTVGQTEITLSPLLTVSHSVHPVFSVQIRRGEHTCVYSSSAYTETAPAAWLDALFCDTDVLILGIHGPRSTKTLYWRADATVEQVVLADPTLHLYPFGDGYENYLETPQVHTPQSFSLPLD